MGQYGGYFGPLLVVSLHEPIDLHMPLPGNNMTARQPGFDLVKRLVALLEERGFAPEQLCSRPEVLRLSAEGTKSLNVAGIPILLQAAVDLTDDPTLMLRLGRQIDIASYGTFGFALMSCTDLHQALHLLLRYRQITGPGPAIQVFDRDEGKALRIKLELGNPNLNQLVTELALSQILHLGELLINQVIDRGELQLGYPAPAHSEAYQALFSMPVRFSQAHSQLLIPKSVLNTPIVTANPAGHVIFQQQCEEMLRSINRVENYSSTVRRVLIQTGGHFPDINQVADRLHISGRTLKRRLGAESTSFRVICSEVKNILACEYLAATELTVSEIADLLDYAEAVSFRRAFVRWNGMTPSQYRQGQGA